MAPNDTIDLKEPKTLTLSPQSIAAILDALADKPYRISNGPINEIFSQLRAAPDQHRGSPSGTGNKDGVPGKGDVAADIHDGVNRDPVGKN